MENYAQQKAIPNKGQTSKSRVLYLPAGPPARTSHRTDSPESDKKLLLLRGGQARGQEQSIQFSLPLTGHSPTVMFNSGFEVH